MFEIENYLLAYIDPGAGSLIVQMLIASFFGAAAVFRRSIFGSFSKKHKGGLKDKGCSNSLGESRDDKSE